MKSILLVWIKLYLSFFYFYPKNKSDLYTLLARYNFIYPVCIDENDSLNKLNHFPSNLEVIYKAEHPEHFNKTITVYCNIESSPLVLKIMRDAE